MDPLEWQQLADRCASRLNEDLSVVETDVLSHPTSSSFPNFWPRVRELNERIRTAPAIKLEDKLALQRRLNELCQSVRQTQKVRQRQNAAQKQQLLESVSIARESLVDAETIEETQQVRADLAALRTQIAELDASFRRDDRQEIWNAWQAANQAAWDRVNAVWCANQAHLSAMLDNAQAKLAARDPRAAKDQIKAFHEAARSHECSHRSLRVLRGRAHDLWTVADELSRKKHEAYVSSAGKRLTYWSTVRERHARARLELARQIANLEERAESAPTSVGAALVRGQVAERRRALAAMEAAERALAKRIEAAESALGRS